MAGQVGIKGQTTPQVVYASKGKSAPNVFATKGRSFPFRTDESPETASNLLTFRMLFGDDNEDASEKDDFLGFDVKDELRKKCKLARDGIAQEICKMEKQIRKAKSDLKRKNIPMEKETKKIKLENVSQACEGSTNKCSSVDLPTPSVGEQQTNCQDTNEDNCIKIPRASTRKPRKQIVRSSKNIVLDETCESAVRPVENTKTTKNLIDGGHASPNAVPNTEKPDEVVKIENENPSSIRAVNSEAKFSAVPEEEAFIGFPVDCPLLVNCKRKLESIAMELEKEDDFLGFPQDHPLRQKCIMRLVKLKAEINSSANFIGFSGNDPLLKSVFDKYKAIASDLSTVIDSIKTKRESALKRLSPSKPCQVTKAARDIQQIIINKSSTEVNPIENGEESNLLNAAVDSRLRSPRGVKGSPQRLHDSEQSTSARKQVKVLHPNVKANIKRVRLGPRIKSVRFCGGPGQTLPVSKFLPDQYPWNQDYGELGGACEESSKEALVDLSSEAAFQSEVGADEGILLGRQRGISGPRSGMINAIIPISTNDILESGFPVVVTHCFPPKPLCFLCGSAGLTQLIFCSVCCEPYHPYCAGDDTLMASFVVLACLPNKSELESPKAVPVRSKSDCSSIQLPNQPQEEGSKLHQKLTSWTCYRCTVCTACGKNKRDNGKNKVKYSEEKFVKCTCCRDTYHTQCLGKRLADGLVEEFEGVSSVSADDENEQQWMCENCAKCRSCGVKLDRNPQDKKKRKNNLMLCLECFKRRQRGSFCPVCNVSYDDNDYETRMMECGKCERWIHARCEGISEEQYQVLSILPESIEFVCKLCDETGCPLWLHAVRTEIITGCESILRRFLKKALRGTRKRKALNFDGVSPNVVTSTNELIVKIPSTLQGVPHSTTKISSNVYGKTDPPKNETPMSSSSLSVVTGKIEEISKKKYDGIVVEFRKNGSKATRRSRRIKPSDSSFSAGKASTNLEPVDVYEISDGSLISIRECKVIVQDVLKSCNASVSKHVQKFKCDNICSVLDNIDSKTDTSPTTQSIAPVSIIDSGLGVSPEFESLEKDRSTCPREDLEKTPKKKGSPEGSSTKTPIGATPVLPHTPSRLLFDFAELVKKQVNIESIPSVMYFREESLLILSEYFQEEDFNRRQQLRDEFSLAVKEVFPWFDPQAIVNSDLPKLQSRISFRMDNTSGDTLLGSKDTFSDMDPFEDTYWSENILDSRVCCFCETCGDLKPNGCGRLLWAGLNEWIHVNCALWSSEVWEEETGALQQVGQALNRSRHLHCAYCGEVGASVSCCHSSCHKSYHFPCSIEAKCALKLDKKVFCKDHSREIPPSALQLEYQVHRKVFVDLDYIKKKEKPILSTEVRVYIGSLRIESLGEIFPISVCRNPESIGDDKFYGTILTPNDYQCTRLYWSHLNPFKKCSYEITGSVRKDWFRNFAMNNSQMDFNIVINHSEPLSLQLQKIRKMNAFHNWIRTAPTLIDEYNVEWIPECLPQLQESYCYTEEQKLDIEQCCELVCQACEAETMHWPHSSNYPKDFYSQWVKFQDEISQNGRFSVNDEPLQLEEYVWLYERLKDIRSLLDQDLKILDESTLGLDCQVNVFSSPGKLQTSFSSDQFVNTFVEKLDYESGKHGRRGGHLDKRLMYNMLDGGVNDSSSDASFSSSSSSTGSSDETDDLSTSEQSSSTESEEEASDDRNSTRILRRLTRNQTQSKNSISTSNPVHPSGRLLRHREKKPEISCKNCKRVFLSKASLSKHGRWCLKKVTTSINTRKRESGSHLSVQLKSKRSAVIVKRQRGRGRPPNKNTLASSKSASARVTQKKSTRESANLVAVSVEGATGFSKEINKEGECQASEDDEQSKTCARCKLVYKTVESLKRHLAEGNCISSDDDESSESDIMKNSSQDADLPGQDVDSNSGSSEKGSLSAGEKLGKISGETSQNLQASVSSGTSSSEEDDNLSSETTCTDAEETIETALLATINQSEEQCQLRDELGLAAAETDEIVVSSSPSVLPPDVNQEIDDEMDTEEAVKVDQMAGESNPIIEDDNISMVSVDESEQHGHNSTTQQFFNSDFGNDHSEVMPPFSNAAGIALSEVQTLSVGPYETNTCTGQENFILQQYRPNGNDLGKVELQKSFESPAFPHCVPSISGMTIPGQHNTFGLGAPPPPESSSSLLSNANDDMNPMAVEYSVLPKMQEFETRDNSFILSSMNCAGIASSSNSSDHFIRIGSSQSMDSQPMMQQQMVDSRPSLPLPVGCNQMSDTQYHQHPIELHSQISSSNEMISWHVSDSSQGQIFVNPNSAHPFDPHLPLQNPWRLSQHHHTVIPPQVQAQPSMQQVTVCTPAIAVAEGLDNSSPNVSQGFPGFSSTRLAQNVSDNNVALIVVQHGNSYSAIPVNQSLQQQSQSVSSVHPHHAHSTMDLPEHLKTQQTACMVMNSHTLPSPLTQQVTQLMSAYPVDQSSHHLNSRIVDSYCGQHESKMIHSSLPTRQPHSCVRSCSCGKINEEHCLPSNTIPFSHIQMPSVDSSFCPAVPKQHLRPNKPVKQLVRQNKPILSRAVESLHSINLPPLFASPTKRDNCPTNVSGLVSSASSANSLEASNLGKVPMSSPNIAVVRPLENPLQKMSNQVAQIGVNFSSSSSLGPVQMPSSITPPFETQQITSRETCDQVHESMFPVQCESAPKFTGDTGQTKPGTLSSQHVPQDRSLAEADLSDLEKITFKPEGDPKGKSIKVTLKRKEGGDTYSINDIKETGIETTGAMRSLKIKAKITSGEQAGTATDVVVTPLIQTIPIVPEIKTTNGQQSSIGYDEKQGLVCTVTVPGQIGQGSIATSDNELLPSSPAGEELKHRRLTHRAVIVYEVKCDNTVLFRSSDVRAVWGHIFEVVQGTRLKHKLPPLPYPATNISLPENRREAANSCKMLGLTHQAVQFLLEQLPGTNSVMEKHKFKFHHPKSEDETLPPASPSGCARTEPYAGRKPFDMFGWLASKHRTVPATVETPTDWARQDLPIAMRYRNLRVKSSNSVGVFYSAIHGRGLFTRRDIQEGEMIIEYAGELIRTILSDLKEKYYESRGIGCYFFTIDENVIIDATMKGNAARFINHSCEPNCKSKAVDILGKKHILIFAERKIFAGEELTYDYKFALEDFDKKIPCTCGARKCRKYLN